VILKGVLRYFLISWLWCFTCSVLYSSVVPNPFLRPGSNRPKPPPVVAAPPPKPVNPQILKEVEFRGFFLLNGIPHFCIYNKKSNFGEWIRLSERTVEEFEADSFDLETETITLIYNGQKIHLQLEAAKASGVSPTKQNSPTVPALPKSTSSTVSSKPKVMPPKPKSTPTLPDWLVQRSQLSSSQPGPSLGTTRASNNYSPARALLPGTFSSSPSPVMTSVPSGQTTGIGLTSPASRVDTSSPGSVVSDGAAPSVSSAFSEQPKNNESLGDNEEIDLSSLPPPPPPPNILPPSGPPDLVPSRDQ